MSSITLSSPAITRGAPTLVVAASNALYPGRADFRCDGTNDEIEIQAAIDALPASGGRILLTEGLFTCSERVVAPVDDTCILINKNDGPIILQGSGWGTILKLADNQPAATMLLRIDGDLGTYRTNSTIVCDMKIDGNKTGNPIVGTHATITPNYAYDTYFINVWFVDPRWACIQAVLDAQRVSVTNCLIDVSNGKTGVRLEAPYADIGGNHFIGSNASGSAPSLAMAVNGDIDIPSSYVSVHDNKFEGGLLQIACSGSRRNSIIGNVFANSTNANSISLQLTSFHHAVMGGYSCFENTIIGNVFYNIRNGIQLAGGSASHEVYRNMIADNIIIEGTDVNLNNGIWETGAFTDNNVIINNILSGATAPITKVGANTVVEGNQGYATESKGAAAAVSDGGTINHGLVTTPTVVIATGSIANEFVSVTALAAGNFTVAIKKQDGSPGTAQTIYWRAFV